MTTNTEQLLSELASEALLTLDGIADTNPRDRADFENKDEWITWAKSRAKWAADKLRAPISRELLAERVLKQMLEQDAALTQPAQAGEAVETVPREWRSALQKLAFVARTSGGTAGPDHALMQACSEAEALLHKPYRYTTPPASQEQSPAWFALVMGAAAAIEDASNCLRDADAKRSAEGAAKHYRHAVNALWGTKASQEQAQQPSMICKTCGADRFKEPCKNSTTCTMIGEAQAQQPSGGEVVKPLFAASVAARKWAELQEQGHRMQSIAFDGGKGGPGTIDRWGKVVWGAIEQLRRPRAT